MFKKSLDTVTNLCTIIAGIATVCMVILINVDVIGRYVFNSPIIGTMDFTVHYLMVSLVFLPLAMVERNNHNISVELVVQLFNRNSRRWLFLISTSVSAIYFGLLAWWGGVEAYDKFEMGEYVMGELGLIVWPGRFLVPLGCAAVAAYFAYKVWRLLVKDMSVVEHYHKIGEDADGYE